MKATLSILAGLTTVMLAGCETPQTGTETMPSGPPEQTIEAPRENVRSAALKTMSERGYRVTPVGSDTLLFDRGADFGSSVRFGFLNNKEAWRRVRMMLIPAGSATRVTAQPALVINRGSAFEREESDDSGNARELMQQILGKIREEARAGH